MNRVLGWLFAGLAGVVAWTPQLPAATLSEPLPTVTVTRTQVPVAMTAYGVVHAEAESVISAKLLARVMELPLREGAPVKAGDLLARLDDRDLVAERDAVSAALARGRAALVEAEAQVARVRALLEKGSATRREAEQAESAYAQARAQVSETEARLAQVSDRLGYTRVVAPFDGRLVARLTEVGEMASPGTPLVRMESTGAFEMWVDVAQRDLERVRLGMPATVGVDGVDGALAGTVRRIVPSADPGSRTFTVKVSLDRTPAGVYAGMFGRVEIAYGTEPALTVPASAVVRRSEVTGVYVMEKGALTFRLIRAGRRVGNAQVVLSGIAEGDVVVIDAERAARQREAGSTR